MAENTLDILREEVGKATCFPDWSFKLADEDGDLRLYIIIDGHNNLHPDQPFRVCHPHPVPTATYNRATWRRWIFDRCMASMTHEMGEALCFGDNERPFLPCHGPGEDPYVFHDYRPLRDAMTTQDGSVRGGASPVGEISQEIARELPDSQITDLV